MENTIATKNKAAPAAKAADTTTAGQPPAAQTPPAALEMTTQSAPQNTTPTSDAAAVTTQGENKLSRDSSGDALPALTHRIAGTPERGFYRAGRHWPREGVDVNRADFTDDQWAALEAEARLAITAL